jgi:hypothetical protein
MFSSFRHRWPYLILAIMFRTFDCIAPKTSNYFAFQSFKFERTWWRLFQKLIVFSKFDIIVLQWFSIQLWKCSGWGGGVGDSYSRYMDYGLYKGCVANYLIISFCRRLVLQYILTIISNLLNTTSFWNNLHQVRSNLKDWKAK